MSNKIWYVRLKPYNPKIGCLVKRYHYDNNLFANHPEYNVPYWHIVEDGEIIDRLRALKQIEGDPMSQQLLDVVTPEEYERITKDEETRRKVELGMMSATAAYADVKVAPKQMRKAPDAGRAAAIPEASVNAPRPMGTDPVVPEPIEILPQPAVKAEPPPTSKPGLSDYSLSLLQDAVALPNDEPALSPTPVDEPAPVSAVAEETAPRRRYRRRGEQE